MLNSIQIQGQFTSTPELTTVNGVKLVQFTLACDRSQRNRKGEKMTDFIPCIAWNKKAEFIATYFKKGDVMLVSGRLQSRNYETQTGRRSVAYEVSVNDVFFCEGKKKRTDGIEDDYIDWDKIPDIEQN